MAALDQSAPAVAMAMAQIEVRRLEGIAWWQRCWLRLVRLDGGDAAMMSHRGGRLGLSISEKMSHGPPARRRNVSVNFPTSPRGSP